MAEQHSASTHFRLLTIPKSRKWSIFHWTATILRFVSSWFSKHTVWILSVLNFVEKDVWLFANSSSSGHLNHLNHENFILQEYWKIKMVKIEIPSEKRPLTSKIFTINCRWRMRMKMYVYLHVCVFNFIKQLQFYTHRRTNDTILMRRFNSTYQQTI